MRFESYAQEFEDLILYCALKDFVPENNGFYIDVGANDPTYDNVTKFFYDRGWHGINIEPLPKQCTLLIEKRPRDINLCVGLGSKRDNLKLFEGGPLSTFLPDIAASAGIPENSQLLKPILTLSEVHEKYCDPKQDIHFCKIDVEGFEREVLEGIKDWQKFRPWIFAIESTLPSTDIPCYDKWEDILLDKGYSFVIMFEVNRYYIDMEREYLLQGFRKIDQFVAQNEICKMVMKRVSFK